MAFVQHPLQLQLKLQRQQINYKNNLQDPFVGFFLFFVFVFEKLLLFVVVVMNMYYDVVVLFYYKHELKLHKVSQSYRP